MPEFHQRPLSGIRVLELGRLVAAPLAGQILGDLGADVVKIEHPDGDEYRRHGPTMVHGNDGRRTSLSSGFISNNRNKRSLIVDFSREPGQALVTQLAGQADILIENFKVGALLKYGLDTETLRRTHPRLIYLSITGFGQNGPYASRPATDGAIQAMSGLQSLTGEPEHMPQKTGALVVDMMTGVYSALAAVAALRHRDNSGSGQHIDMALLDCAMSMIAPSIMEYRLSGTPPRRQGNAQPGAVPAQIYACRDGNIHVQAAIDTHFVRLCDCIGMPELAEDQRFSTRSARLAHEAELNALLTPFFARESVNELLEIFSRHNIICAPVNSVADALEDPQVKARGVELNLETSVGANIPSLASPLRFSNTPVAYDRPPPEIGEHSDEVLTSWLGIDQNMIADLRARRVIL